MPPQGQHSARPLRLHGPVLLRAPSCAPLLLDAACCLSLALRCLGVCRWHRFLAFSSLTSGREGTVDSCQQLP